MGLSFNLGCEGGGCEWGTACLAGLRRISCLGLGLGHKALLKSPRCGSSDLLGSFCVAIALHFCSRHRILPYENEMAVSHGTSSHLFAILSTASHIFYIRCLTVVHQNHGQVPWARLVRPSLSAAHEQEAAAPRRKSNQTRNVAAE